MNATIFSVLFSDSAHTKQVIHKLRKGWDDVGGQMRKCVNVFLIRQKKALLHLTASAKFCSKFRCLVFLVLFFEYLLFFKLSGFMYVCILLVCLGLMYFTPFSSVCACMCAWGDFNPPPPLPLRYGIFERCRELVEAGFDVRQPDKENVTLLHWAAINNRIDLVKWVQSCLHMVVSGGSEEVRDLKCVKLEVALKY